MTWSLKISNGDLAKGYDNNLEVVRGSEKVVQDLMCWIRHPVGTDPMNPDLGSLIEYGEQGKTYMINKEMVVLPEEYEDLVVSEINRLIRYYQSYQGMRIEQEINQFGRIVTYDQDEIINNFNIDYIKNYDTLYISVNLETISGELYRLNIPIQNEATVRGI